MGDMSERAPTLAPARRFVSFQRFRLFARSVNNRFRTLGRRVGDLAVTLDPLVDHVAHTERELHDLEHRVTRLERRQARRPTAAKRS